MQFYEDMRILKVERSGDHDVVKFAGLTTKLTRRCEYALVWIRYGETPRISVLMSVSRPPKCNSRLVPSGYTYAYAEDTGTKIAVVKGGPGHFDNNYIWKSGNRIMYRGEDDETSVPMMYDDGEELILGDRKPTRNPLGPAMEVVSDLAAAIEQGHENGDF